MIADTAVLSTSPWSSDHIMGQDFYLRSDSLDLSSATAIPNLDSDIEFLKEARDPVDSRHLFSSLATSSSGLSPLSCSYMGSVASSDCSDETSIDIEGDGNDQLLTTDQDVEEYMNSSLLNIIEDDKLDGFPWSHSVIEDVDDVGAMMDLVSDTITYQPDDNLSSTITPEVISLNHKNVTSCQNVLTDNTRWSAMSNSKQVKVIEELTKVISQHMGLREQLEVIKIINPEALVSPTDTEFVIELDCLNDDKLKKIQDFVRRHVKDKNSNSSSSSSCSSHSDSGSECSTPVQKRQTKRQRKNQQRVVKKRQQKDHRQSLKEKRSGLFKQEEVVALTNCKPDEFEDIDILT